MTQRFLTPTELSELDNMKIVADDSLAYWEQSGWYALRRTAEGDWLIYRSEPVAK